MGAMVDAARGTGLSVQVHPLLLTRMGLSFMFPFCSMP